jgi:DNA repair protein RadA/Sms
MEKRIGEAAKLGFERCLCPHRNIKGLRSPKTIRLVGVQTITEALETMLAS